MKLRQWWRDPVNRNYLYSFFKNFAFFSAVLVPFFTDWGHITLFQVQLLQSWFSVWVFILEVPTGVVADKIGRKHSLTLGAIFLAVATMLYGSIPVFTNFLLAEFLFAIGDALNSGADQALLYDTLKAQNREDEGKKVLGYADALMLAGMAVAALVGSVIAAKLGLNMPQILTAIPMLIAGVIAWSIPEPRIHTEQESKRYIDIFKEGLHLLRRHPVVRALALDSTFVAAAAYFVVWFYQPYMESLHIPVIYFGIAQAGMLMIEMLVSANFTHLEKILGKEKAYLKSTAFLVMITFVIAALFHNLVSLVLFIVIGGGLGFTRATYVVGLISKHIPSHSRATVLSSISMLRRLALVPLNPVMGAVATYSLPLALASVSILPLGALLTKESVPVKIKAS